MGTNISTKQDTGQQIEGQGIPAQAAAARLLQALPEAARRILSAPSRAAAGSAALEAARASLPGYLGGCILFIHSPEQALQMLARDPDQQEPAWSAWGDALMEESWLKNGQPRADWLELPSNPAILTGAPARWLRQPLIFDGSLIGMLLLAFTPSTRISDLLEPAVQVLASFLGNALHQLELDQVEHQRREEAEAMRDIMAALASAGNLNQTLQIILVNLRNVIPYDRAGLYLLDENQHYVLAEKPRPEQERSFRINQADDPLVTELQHTRAPILVEDIQTDPRFEAWPDMQPVHGWLGSPLFLGEEMIGFLSLGSLECGGFDPSDAAMIQAFTRQIAQVLESAWLYEQSHRRTEELEVLSTLTFALGEAESRESTLSTIVGQIGIMLKADNGSFLSPDEPNASLVVRFSQDEDLSGKQHPAGNDLLWQVIDNGEASILRDVPAFLARNSHGLYSTLFQDSQCAVLVPLRSQDSTFGLLCFSFMQRRSFTSADTNLISAVAEIAAASLQRAQVLEGLEKKVNVRTRHLSTLYTLNAIANEPLALQVILERLLGITLETFGCRLGAIHLLDPAGSGLYLAAHQNLPEEMQAQAAYLPVKAGFWKGLIANSNPLISPDLRLEERLPEAIRSNPVPGATAYIGTPIRAKGETLGLLSMYAGSISDYTIDDLTLFMTIADQIGISVERDRLIRQLELAAVVEERQRLARELHDSVTQMLYSQVLFAGAGLKAFEQHKLDLLEQHLQRLDQGALQALKEMRLLVYELRPSDHLEVGLATALQHRLDAVEKRTGMNASLSIQGDLNLDESTEMALYRIAQEALNNTLKHASARSVSIQLNSSSNQITLDITDDGCGFDLEQGLRSGGMGLTSMEERTAALGGLLAIQTAPGLGTRVTVTIEEAI